MRNVLGNKYKIIERKSSAFGTVGIVDRGNELTLSPNVFNRQQKWTNLAYYNSLSRKEIYKTALDKYLHDQLARPLINLIVHATFSERFDFQGDEEIVKRAKQIWDDSEIDTAKIGADLEVHGDVFLRSFLGEKPKIASIPAQTIDIDYDENNIIDIKAYYQNKDSADKIDIIPATEMSHIKINCTTNTVYGNSTLRPIFWWLDVLDNLWERNWIRAAQYYGAPIVAITGVPGESINAVKAKLEEEGQRPGKNWVFPPEVKVDTLDFTKNYPIENLIDRVYQYILAACNVPQHLIYEADSSRGVAMFSGDAFEMMIKVRQKTWEQGIVRAIRNILEAEGVWQDESKLKIKFAPVFSRDLKNVVAMVEAGVVNKIMSKKSAREVLKLDHDEEIENFKQQEKDEPDELPQQIGPDGKPIAQPFGQKPAPNQKPNTNAKPPKAPNL